MLELGLGAQEALSVPGTGAVIGAYGKAAYLRVPGGLFALTGPEVVSGPIHARTDRADMRRLRVGDRVVVTATLLEAGPVLLDLGAATVWRGHLPAVAPTSADLDVEGLAARLGGAGPGLTPAGDDFLAGVLLVARLSWGESAEERLVRVARTVPTNDVARAFLVWAARGQCVEPVHRFLLGRSAGALAAVRRLGHTSGAALADGLLYALQAFATPVQWGGAGWGPLEPAGGPAWQRSSLPVRPSSALADLPLGRLPITTGWCGPPPT